MAIDYRHPRRGGSAATGGSQLSSEGAGSPAHDSSETVRSPVSASGVEPTLPVPGPPERILGIDEVRELCRVAVARLDEPHQVDADGMFSIIWDPILLHVWPRPWPNSPGGCVVLVAADVLSYVRPSEALGVGLLRRNFDMLFGAFALRASDSGRHILGFDHVLLGDHLTLAEIENAIGFIGGTARQLTPELAEKYGGQPPLYQPNFPVTRMTVMSHFVGADPANRVADALQALPINFTATTDYWIHQRPGLDFYLGCFLDDAGEVTVALTPHCEPTAELQFAREWLGMMDAWRAFTRDSVGAGGPEELISARRQQKFHQLIPVAVGPLPQPAEPKRGRRR